MRSSDLWGCNVTEINLRPLPTSPDHPTIVQSFPQGFLRILKQGGKCLLKQSGRVEKTHWPGARTLPGQDGKHIRSPSRCRMTNAVTGHDTSHNKPTFTSSTCFGVEGSDVSQTSVQESPPWKFREGGGQFSWPSMEGLLISFLPG